MRFAQPFYTALEQFSTRVAIALEEVNASTNSSSKEANVIVNNSYASNQSPGSIGIFNIVHCTSLKVVNVAATGHFLCASTVSLESSIGQNCQALFASSITSIGLSPALAVTYVTSICFNSPASAISHTTSITLKSPAVNLNNTRIGLSPASAGAYIDIGTKSLVSFNPLNMSIGTNCLSLYISHTSKPDHNFSASAVT